MFKSLFVLVFCLLYSCSSLNPSKNISPQVLFSIAEDSVSTEEFMYAFTKNSKKDTSYAKSDIDEYLDLYINFKLKVHEAKNLGYDTMSSFHQEFNKYRRQLDDSYLKADSETERLVREAYDRSTYEIKASHILIQVDKNASVGDTMKAYNSIIKLRQQALNGDSFSKLAHDFSQDPSAKSNNGSLGYFSALQMVYPFETMAYNTTVDEISMPFRTSFGYHILLIEDKRPAEGKVEVAHIMLRASASKDSVKIHIDRIYDKLKHGENWDELCNEYSEDVNSAAKGGLLAPFSRAQILPSFGDVAFSLTEAEQISRPFKTQYGWHIIKLIKKAQPASYDEVHDQLESMVKRDSRSKVNNEVLVERLKIENGYVENKRAITSSLAISLLAFDKGKWNFTNEQLTDTTTLFGIASKKYSRGSFYKSVTSQHKHDSTTFFLSSSFNQYRNNQLIEFEKSHLSEKYPDYRHLIEEYHDGILLFNIMIKEVWDKATNDSTGLNEFYETHQENYYKPKKLSADTFTGPSKIELDSVRKYTNQLFELNRISDEQKQSIIDHFNTSSPLPLQIDNFESVAKYQPNLAQLALQIGDTIITENEKWYYIRVYDISEDYVQELNDIRGTVLNDYQKQIENKWIQKLKTQYPVNIDNKGLKYVYHELEHK